MRLFTPALVAILSSDLASGQTYKISTIAGGGLPVNISGTSASLGATPSFIAADQSGNVFFVGQNTVLRLDATTHILTLFAGSGITGFSGDGGPATSAGLYNPQGICVGLDGSLYIADTMNNRVRKVSKGVITTIAGNGTAGYSGDNGAATGAQLNAPDGVAVDSAGNVYISDSTNQRIRKVSGGIITTAAGDGKSGYSGDGGVASSAELSNPQGIAVDSAGNAYFADNGNQRIRKISGGMIVTVAGDGFRGYFGDKGPATSAELDNPMGIAVDSAGNLYIADTSNRRIRKVSNGVITTAAGNGSNGFSGDNGPATAAQLYQAAGLAADGAGNLYIADTLNVRIREVAGGVITTIAGNGMLGTGGDGGTASGAQLAGPYGVVADSVGNLYIADTGDSSVRKVSSGVITTVAGNGSLGYNGDTGLAANIQLALPQAVAVDSADNLYIADTLNQRVRKVSGGMVSTVAGNGRADFSGDGGPATSAALEYPSSIAFDSAGHLYIAASGRIREVANGTITTVVGGGVPGYVGANEPATSAWLGSATAVAVDVSGDLYVADAVDNTVSKVSNGIITAFAGAPQQGNGYSGDNGAATSAGLFFPGGVAVDAAGTVYIADTVNNRIRKVSNGIITTIAGTGTAGFSGDGGSATGAQLNGPQGVAVDSHGNVYIADTLNNRIRLLQQELAINPGGVLNAASSAAGSPVAPGSIAAAYGSFLVPSLITATVAPLAISLGGVSLSFGGSLASPLFAVSGGQINFQVPWELSGQSEATLVVAAKGQTSEAQPVTLAPYAPGIFSMNGQGTGQGAILDTNYSLVNSSNPAIAGATVLQIYCTGLGAVTNQPPSGSPASTTKVSPTTATPSVTIGGSLATVLFSGLAPGSVGEYQVNALVPAGSSKGAAIPVVISIGGITSTVTIAVE